MGTEEWFLIKVDLNLSDGSVSSSGFCEMPSCCCLPALKVFSSWKEGGGGNLRPSKASSAACVCQPLHPWVQGPLRQHRGTVLPCPGCSQDPGLAGWVSGLEALLQCGDKQEPVEPPRSPRISKRQHPTGCAASQLT